MSSEMEDRIKELTNIGDHQPTVVLWAGSVEDAEKWEKLFHRLAQNANDGSETGYDTYPLQDEMGLLSWSTTPNRAASSFWLQPNVLKASSMASIASSLGRIIRPRFN
jgi:hypothetical protein